MNFKMFWNFEFDWSLNDDIERPSELSCSFYIVWIAISIYFPKQRSVHLNANYKY